jgi:hypothetical protein
VRAARAFLKILITMYLLTVKQGKARSEVVLVSFGSLLESLRY